MPKRIDLTGKKFGRLTAIEPETINGRRKWKCKCDCGKEIYCVTNTLTGGKSKSCGCLSAEKAKVNNTTHGKSKTRIYRIWEGMKARTTNKKHIAYNRYKNVKVCKEWENFENFYKWSMENGYKDGLTIDRIDNNKGYSPDNCRWTSYKTQGNNTNRNHLLKYKGEEKTMAEWAEKMNIPYGTLKYRIYNGWSIEKALETPVKKKHCP